MKITRKSEIIHRRFPSKADKESEITSISLSSRIPFYPFIQPTKFSFLPFTPPRIYHNHVALVPSQSFRTVILTCAHPSSLDHSSSPLLLVEKVLSISPRFPFMTISRSLCYLQFHPHLHTFAL